jgi:hypothetical protein
MISSRLNRSSRCDNPSGPREGRKKRSSR